MGLDHLRQGIGLRAYGQKDPLNEYKREAFMLFDDMLSRLRETVTTALSHLELRFEEPAQVAQAAQSRATGEMHARHADPLTGENEVPDGVPAASGTTTLVRPPASAFDADNPATWGKVRRNAPCPCGSGKKYKQCHGKVV